MKSIYVMGPSGSGKTAICAALALKFLEKGLTVSYFKPVGSVAGADVTDDEDALLMKSILNMETPVETMVRLTASPYYLSKYRNGGDYLGDIVAAFKDVSRDVDVVIVGGATWPYAMGSLGLDAFSLAREFGSMVLVVQKIENDYSVDQALSNCEMARLKGLEVLGTILNNVPRQLLDKTRGVYKPLVEERGFKVLGVVPKRLEIAAPTVREFAEVLGGEILTGEDNLDLLVEDVMVGAMTLDSALSYLRRATNKALITGGDRADLALAAMETSTSAIILTGGLYPDVRLIARASEKNIPVILVHYDTYTTIEMLHEVTRKIKPTDVKGINLAKENLEKHCDWKEILARVKKEG